MNDAKSFENEEALRDFLLDMEWEEMNRLWYSCI